MLIRIFKFLILLIITLVIIYFLGPTPDFEPVDNDPITFDIPLNELDKYIANKEAKVTNIKPGTEAEIVWLDSIRKTEYAIVYLHGYSASKGEGEPIHKNLAKKYGCNLYLPRLFKHNLTDVDAFTQLTPKGLVESAKEAVAIGKLLGEKVILMSTSTGGTLSTYLASNDPAVSMLVMMAPNLDLADPNSHLLNDPWGLQLMRLVNGSDYRTWDGDEEVKKWWTTKNRIEGLVALRELMDQSMTEKNWEKINIPVCIVVYYESEEKKDHVVSIEAMEKFIGTVSTPEDQVLFRKLANGTDHPLGSKYINDNWMDVQKVIEGFLDGLGFLNLVNEEKSSSLN